MNAASPVREDRAPFVATLAVLAVVLGALFAAQAFAPADRWLHDAAAQWLRDRHPQPVERDVVLVGIDEQTYRALREPFALWHPHLGRFLKGIAGAAPAAVGLDIVLPDRSFDFLLPGRDLALAEGLLAMRKAAPLALARALDEDGNARPVYPPFASIAGAEAFGSTAVCRDADRVTRRFDETGCAGTPPGPTLAGRMARQLGVTEPGRGWIDWSAGDAIKYLPLQEVLGWIERGEQARLEQAFRGKPVLLGSVLPYEDRHALPVRLAGFEPDARMLPGVLIHVQALRSLLHRGVVRELPAPLRWMLAAATWLFFFGATRPRKVLLLVAAVAAALAAGVSALWQGLWIGAASLALLALLAFAARAAFDALRQSRERRLLRGAFAAYVSPPVMKEILAGRIRADGAGTRGEVCVLACELPGFDARAAALPPERAVELLDTVFRDAAEAVLRRGGSTHKFTSHGLLALFGAPQPLANPARSALEAAQEILEALDRLNGALVESGQPALARGIGIASGHVTLGHVGGEWHREYTAIGAEVDHARDLARAAALAAPPSAPPVLCTPPVARAVGGAGGLADLGTRQSLGPVWGWQPPGAGPHQGDTQR